MFVTQGTIIIKKEKLIKWILLEKRISSISIERLLNDVNGKSKIGENIGNTSTYNAERISLRESEFLR